MKDFKYYEEKCKKDLISTVKEAFEVMNQESVTLAVDFTVKSVAELDKPSSQHALRRIWRKKARSEMEEDKKPGLRMIIPVPGSKLNEIELDKGIPLPAYAAMILETHEITETQMVVGLFLMLKITYDEYYLKLLRSFTLDESILVPELKEMRDEGLKYWKRRKISTKIKK